MLRQAYLRIARPLTLRLTGSRWWYLTLSVLSVVGFLALWQVASLTGLFGRYDPRAMAIFLPPPLAVMKTFGQLIGTGQYPLHLATSLYRVGVGFGLAAVIAIPLGMAMARWSEVDAVCQPYVRFFQPIPGVAWVPLAIVWFGLGDRAAIFIIVVGALFPLLLATVQGLREVDPTLSDAARTLGAGPWQLFTRVTLPSMVPNLVTGSRLAMGFAWRVVLAAEMVGVSRGLGYMLSLGRGTGRTDITLATMVTIGVLMAGTDALVFAPLDRLTSAWRPQHDRGQGVKNHAAA